MCNSLFYLIKGNDFLNNLKKLLDSLKCLDIPGCDFK